MLHAHYKDRYYNYRAKLESENITESSLSLTEFRAAKKHFYEKLLAFANKPGVYSFADGDLFSQLVANARETLHQSFPDHVGCLTGIDVVPMIYLPFINYSENPSFDVMGYAMKLDQDRSIVVVKAGTGAEFLTTLHEYLHTTARGLPSVFEEGFCRYSLQHIGLDQRAFSGVLTYSPAIIRKYFNEIFYPHLLVSLLAEAFSDRNIHSAFFGRDVSDLERGLACAIGTDFAELTVPYDRNPLRKATIKNVEELSKPVQEDLLRDAMEIILLFKLALAHSLSNSLLETVQKLSEIILPSAPEGSSLKK